ncbi:MAG: SDR family NAD(P)-dependent oxidoreductase [Actinomycetota bacterium]|nr:SDR family NAD(P)-dependent oxidoreductase [Actinomycetota bacterium]
MPIMEACGVALVTGASRGIGRAVAIDLAEAGFDVVASMRNPDEGADLSDLVQAGSGSVIVTHLDMDDPSTMEIPEGLKVLVNNAGIERQYLPVEEASIDEWRAVFETNLFGLVELTRRAIPEMRKQGGAVICNVTSSSILAAVPFYSIYRASKAAVSAMGESLRCEVADFGIRVVEVMPGPVDTDMLARSDRVPEAVDSDGYREMAEAAYAARKGVAGMVIPAPVAANRIRSIILDDAAPLKSGVDDLSVGLLKAWSTDPISLVGTPYAASGGTTDG